MDTRKNTTELSAKKFKYLIIVLGGGAFFAVLFHGFLSFTLVSQADTVVTDLVHEEINIPAPNPFADIALEARAAYVFDLSTKKVLFAKNENEKLPLASVTKLMTALVARDYTRNDVIITLVKEDLSVEGDSGLFLGERWRMGDILDVMLLVSSNDAAHAIAGFVGTKELPNMDTENAQMKFINMMNEKARTLGFSTMEFFNESGLDIENKNTLTPTKAGGYGSAREVASLMATLWKSYPETTEITSQKNARITSRDNILHILSNTNEAIGHFPGMLVSKTGYTDLAGGNLVILFDVGIGHPIVAVVLGSTYKGRFEDMRSLTQATLKTLN